MIHWLAAAGLLATGMYHNAKGYSGKAPIDFGRVIPGHHYFYKAYFRNDSGVPLRINGETGCGGCPRVSSRGGRLAPGDSTEISFSGYVKPGLRDSLCQDVLLYTDDGDKRGLWAFRLRFVAGKPHMVRMQPGPVDVEPNKDGYLQGSITMQSIFAKPLLVSPAGMPHGVRYGTELPLRLPPGGRAVLEFWAPPEVFTSHRSITLEAVPDGGGAGQRFSLPFSP